MSRPPTRAGLPLSHYGAKRDFKKIIPNGIVVHTSGAPDALDLVTFVEALPGVGVLQPAFNGNFDHDQFALRSVLSTETIRALLAVARAGGDELPADSIERIAKEHQANTRVVCAYFGCLQDIGARWVGYDANAIIPVDLSDGEFLAVLAYFQRHFPGCKVRGCVLVDLGSAR